VLSASRDRDRAGSTRPQQGWHRGLQQAAQRPYDRRPPCQHLHFSSTWAYSVYPRRRSAAWSAAASSGETSASEGVGRSARRATSGAAASASTSATSSCASTSVQPV